VTNNQVARKAIHFALDKRNKRRLLTKIDDQNYDVAGILQFGLAYVFVRDRNLNTIEKAKGKKFNNNQVDAIAAPAYAFKPLEIERAISKNGAMFSFPVVNITGDLIIHPEKFPENFAAQSREWFIEQLPRSFAMVKRLENSIPERYKLNLSKEDELRYQKILRDGRMGLTKQGVYDPMMMSVLKRARCTIERTRFECSLGGE